MEKILLSLLWLMACTGIAPAQTTAASFHFNGTSFQAGTAAGVPSVIADNGYLPYLDHGAVAATPAKLPAGSGGLVVLCHVQSAGGKVKSGGYGPIAGAAIEVRSARINLLLRSDTSGFLIMALPAGDYELRFAGYAKKVRIDRERNTLMAIRGGKRMVD